MGRVHTNEHSERERKRINAPETIKCEKCEVARGKPVVFVISRCSKCRQMGEEGGKSAFLCALLARRFDEVSLLDEILLREPIKKVTLSKYALEKSKLNRY